MARNGTKMRLICMIYRVEFTYNDVEWNMVLIEKGKGSFYDFTHKTFTGVVQLAFAWFKKQFPKPKK